MTTMELSFTKNRIEKLEAIAKKLHNLAEVSCNYGLTERQEKREEKLFQEAEKIADELGFIAYQGGDPRGAMFVLTQEKDSSYYEVKEGVYF